VDRGAQVVAVLGLGEAGGRLATDLAALGVEVRSYDPDPARDVPSTARTPDPAAAAAGSDVVLSVNSARAALDAAAACLPALSAATIYADLNTASPELKRELATLVGAAGAPFADVALLGPIPTRGLQAPVLASGEGALAFADLFVPLGMPVEVISEDAGDAAALKLVRSVFMKGLAAAVVESMQAAERSGHADWLADEIAGMIGRPFLERALEGSRTHAARRVDEMEAARDLLVELGVEPRIASASAAQLAELARHERGVPS
jgi:3-hydroxyisobutyrate dehydrogenase-like beta-hydroxyacid dehydrogenase